MKYSLELVLSNLYSLVFYELNWITILFGWAYAVQANKSKVLRTVVSFDIAYTVLLGQH